jgi:hypothetical protein
VGAAKGLGVYRLNGTETGYSMMLNLEFRSANGTVRFFIGSLHLLRPPVYAWFRVWVRELSS